MTVRFESPPNRLIQFCHRLGRDRRGSTTCSLSFCRRRVSGRIDLPQSTRKRADEAIEPYIGLDDQLNCALGGKGVLWQAQRHLVYQALAHVRRGPAGTG